MNIPEVPTDNLYKFAAIVGALVAIVPFAFMTFQVTEGEIEVAEVEALSATASLLANAEMTRFEDRFVRVGANVKSARDSLELLSPDQQNPETSRVAQEDALNALSQYETMLDEQLALTKRVADLIRPVAVRVARADARNDSLGSLLWYAAGLSLAGVGLSSWGFLMWYRRVQKFQDAILASQAQSPGRRPRTRIVRRQR